MVPQTKYKHIALQTERKQMKHRTLDNNGHTLTISQRTSINLSTIHLSTLANDKSRERYNKNR